MRAGIFSDVFFLFYYYISKTYTTIWHKVRNKYLLNQQANESIANVD